MKYNMLEQTKRADEIAIEQDEQTAKNWLESVNMSYSRLHYV